MRKWIPATLVAAMWVFTLVVWSRLPARLPVHWDIHGTVDRYGGRAEAALLAPALATVLWLVLRWLPRIDPRRENYAKFAGSYDLVVVVVLAILAAVHVAVLGAALGWPVPVARVMPVVIGVALVIIGNVLPRARPNWWFGIRTPWTLSSDRVWVRTHRVGGYALVAAGFAVVATAVLPEPLIVPVLLVAVIGASLFSVVYSYLAWKQETSR